MRKGNVTILASILAITLVAMAVGAGTMALLSDVELSEDNTFTAGTLNLVVGNPDPTTWTCTIEDIYPGQTGIIEVPFTVEGTMKGYVDVRITNVQDAGGVLTEPEESEFGTTDDGEMSGELKITMIGMDGMTYSSDDMTFENANGVWWWKGGYLGIFGAPGVTYNPPAMDSIKIYWELPGTVGNDVQGDVLTFDIAFTLDQGTSGWEYTP